MKSYYSFEYGTRRDSVYLDLTFSLIKPWASDGDYLVGFSVYHGVNIDGRPEMRVHPLPGISLSFMHPLITGMFGKRRSRAAHLFERGDRRDGWHISAIMIPWDCTVGTTWYRDNERFELTLSPIPFLTLFATRVEAKHR
jgi:hypothetical protein